MAIVLCHSEWHVDCLSFSSPIIFFCALFLFSFASTKEVLSFATNPSSFVISTFQCSYCYRCHVQSLGLFIFRTLDCHYQLLDDGQVLCVGLTLPCRSFRQLLWCCIEWLFSYLVRWLPCIRITAMKKLICVIKVVEYFLFFQDWPARYWVLPTGTALLLFHHLFLSISMWRPIICHRVNCFWSGICFLTLPKWLFTLGVYQRLLYWHPNIPLNVNIITPGKLHYIWRPWGWMPSTILESIRLVICFLLLH